MFLIRSIAMAQPGRRDELVALMKEFMSEMPGFEGITTRILTASVGPSDSTIIAESEHPTMADFEQRLDSSNRSEKMAKYGPKFGELSIPGSHRFEIYRIHR